MTKLQYFPYVTVQRKLFKKFQIQSFENRSGPLNCVQHIREMYQTVSPRVILLYKEIKGVTFSCKHAILELLSFLYSDNMDWKVYAKF